MFIITPEKFDVIPPKTQSFRKSKPAPFGLDTLMPNESAFIPFTANPAADRLAGKSTSKALSYLSSYLHGRYKLHHKLKTHKIVIRREGLGIRIYRIT